MLTELSCKWFIYHEIIHGCLLKRLSIVGQPHPQLLAQGSTLLWRKTFVVRMLGWYQLKQFHTGACSVSSCWPCLRRSLFVSGGQSCGIAARSSEKDEPWSGKQIGRLIFYG